ncbi:MAG: dTDP-4-dehydrorhamnose 3,5-epimerase family protein [Spirochaetota bacterium]
MEFTEGRINGVHVQDLVKYLDERGFLIETFRKDQLPEGLVPVMSYVSYTEPGVARGPHEHRHQTDIFSFLGPGNFKLKLWDNRIGSTTRANTMTVFAGEDRPVLVVVPPGVVHAYLNISRTARGMVINYPDRLYRGEGKTQQVDEIRHEAQGDEFYRDFLR